MRILTLRNVPEDLMQIFKRRAQEQHTSLNKAVIGLLLEKFDLSRKKEPVVHDDLDAWLAKSWTKEEADEFDACLRDQRRIDPRDWQ